MHTAVGPGDDCKEELMNNDQYIFLLSKFNFANEPTDPFSELILPVQLSCPALQVKSPSSSI